MEGFVVTPDRIMKLGHGFRESKALLSAVELGVFTVLAERPLDLEMLSKGIGVDQRGARDFFDTLVALGMLERDGHGRYSNTPQTDLYLDRGKPTYIGEILDHLNTRLYAPWNSLTPALRTGKPQSGTTVTGYFPALYADNAALKGFVRTMTGSTRPVAKALADKFRWQDFRTVIDIGAAEGCVPVEVAQVHAHVTGGGFDLPPVKALFDAYVRENGLSNRLHFYAGDFFADPLPAADVLVLGRVLHNWDLPTKTMLLKKAYDALPPGGAIIVYERLIDDDRRVNAEALLSSLNMLIMTSSGSDFTGAACIGWMHEAGFHSMRVEPLTNEQSMVVGTK
jgi:hypothetical protein